MTIFGYRTTLSSLMLAATAAALILGGPCGSLNPAWAAGKITDLEIANAVDDELMDDPAVPADGIIVSAQEGIVTLGGNVNSLLAKDRAAAIAETVKGVRAVVNRIEVTAPFRSDTEIAEDVKEALLMDPATESWQISASVENGVVRLSGGVDSWQEKELAAKVAKGVKGVKGIDNDIAVDYDADRSDAEIKEEVQKALRWDAYVDHALIEVLVADGNVSLTGIVGSAAEKSRARADAWVVGVKSVDAGNLQVKYWARNERLRKNKYASRPESEIAAAVQDAFFYDPRIDRTDITVEMDGGIATLRGVVDDLKEKRTAGSVARGVVGVWGVVNRIKVRPSVPPSDLRIESRVENALLRDPYVERYEITVTVVDGEVYLYGDVDSNFEKAQADDAASRQVGVVEVNNFLTVQDDAAATYDPYVDDWYLYDYEWYDPDFTTSRTDWEIEKDIEDELFWSPFVDADEVDVRVDGGIAELSGTVDTWSEREAAKENALEGGAVSVDNDLKVEFGPDYYQP